MLGGGGINNENSKWHHKEQPPVTSRAVLEFAYNVTLAQAQECILEKSMMDGRKPLIIGTINILIHILICFLFFILNKFKNVFIIYFKI